MSERHTLTIALDIDDTITRHPAFFAVITRALIEGGHRIIVITFREDRESAEHDLQGWGIAYDQIVTWSSTKCDLAEMDSWKAQVCREYNVDVFFEDDPSVLAFIDPSTVCFMPFTAKETVRAVT